MRWYGWWEDVHVNLRHAANQKLELPLVKDVDQLVGYELEQALPERAELVLDARADPIPLKKSNLINLLIPLKHIIITNL